MMRHTRQTGEFVAKDEQGREYVVLIFTEFIEVSTLGGTETIPGLKSLQLDSGERVNRRGQGRYETVHTGLQLTSDDPNAP